ncbi:hypothetical protein AVEN_56382-1 [Araneus ventricosus]|uniref:Uncharacterized protein n=1 Tax=Araneus ventricosus TaxID=182803 RepID=A0A4Y2X649_ARAVE|nr:hypothetical protein AVEN_56382-1 [Araneus ventricosus]
MEHPGLQTQILNCPGLKFRKFDHFSFRYRDVEFETENVTKHGLTFYIPDQKVLKKTEESMENLKHSHRWYCTVASLWLRMIYAQPEDKKLWKRVQETTLSFTLRSLELPEEGKFMEGRFE